MQIKDSRKFHFFWAHNIVFDEWGSVLKPNGIAVYLCLVRHANRDGTCYPSFSTIAKKCGICRRTAINVVNQLVDLGLVKRERCNKQGSQEKIPNLYTIVDLSLVSSAGDALGSAGDALGSAGDALGSAGDALGSAGDAPKGNTEKETQKRKHKKGQTDRQTNPHSKYVNCKNDASQSSVVLNTDNQSEKPQSQSDASITPSRSTDESSIALDISNLKWPKALEQNQIVMKALAKLPDDQARQAILDIVAKKLDNGTLQKPVSFLRKVVDNYLMGDFTPLERTSREVKGSSNKAADRQVYAPNECPYCDEQNILTYEVVRTGEVQRTSCKHYHDTPEIGMKRGLRCVSPRVGNKSQFRSIGEILESRVKDVDEVPF
ncbi:helix-turn-helix domain-containing protein [Candidatus Albibeggiatoa sp. nov. BB20]|uniref:helix-turn-helix domain-containing protein n=1 Tax=Candidatus Albibeggiatoa sp. nov. BB20 TaxID=3162723 RepID=UPI003365A5A1